MKGFMSSSAVWLVVAGLSFSMAQGLEAQWPGVARPVQPPFIPPSMTPPFLTPPAMTPPPSLPPATISPLLSPPAMTPPSLTPPALNQPDLVAPSTTPPELTPPFMAPPSLPSQYPSVVGPGVSGWNQANNRMFWPWPYTDQELLGNVYLQFSRDSFLNATGIRVQVHRGIVVLRGGVPTWRDFNRAQTDAMRAGAAYVRNRLHILGR
jgi:BON domain